MKHKILRKLIVGSLAAVVLLSGCGAQETISMGTGGKPSGIHMSEGAKYQYQSVEPSDIIVEYSGLKPDCSLDKVDGTYLLDSSVYEGDTFGIYLDGEYFGTTIEEYVPYSDIQWAMVDNTEFWSVYGSRATSDMIDTSMIEGKVIYADGSEMVIEPERVWGTLGGGEVDYKLSVVYRDKVYEVSSPCPWLDWDMSGSDGEVADVSGSVVLNPEGTETVSNTETSDSTQGTRYSIADCPELTNLDWDEFNKVVEVYIPDLFSIIGADPRVDWSEVNDHFNEYYGGSDGVGSFYSDMYWSYYFGYCDDGMSWLGTLVIEPYGTRLDENSEYYDELYGKVYAEIHANEVSERNEVLKGYPSYLDMLIGEGGNTCGDDLDALARYTASMVEGYLNSDDETVDIDGFSVKADYECAFNWFDDQVFNSCVVVDGEDIVDANFSKYITFHDAVQGYLGDKASYAELVYWNMDVVRNFKWGDDISAIYKYY